MTRIENRRMRSAHAKLLLACLSLCLLFLLGVLAVHAEVDASAPSSITTTTTTTSLAAQHQTSLLNRQWWRNLEEQDTFIRSLFRKPLATANIGVVGSAIGSSSSSDSNENDEGSRIPAPSQTARPYTSPGRPNRGAGGRRAVAHHAPANSTGPEPRIFIPKLHMVYTMTREEKRMVEAQAVVATASPTTSTAATGAGPTEAEGGAGTPASSTYTQMLRAVLPRGFGWVSEATPAPPTPLQVAARRSPFAHLRAAVLRDDEAGHDEEQQTEKSTTATTAGAANGEAGTDVNPHARMVTPAAAAAAEADPATSKTKAEATPVRPTAPSSPSTPANGEPSLSQTHSSAEERLVIVSSDTRALVPLNITGSSYTIVQFNGKAGNTINAVVQLKDHRFNKNVPKNNCYNMYITVELRNHVKTNSLPTVYRGDAAKHETLNSYAQVYKNLWNSNGAPAKSKAEDADNGNTEDDSGTSSDPDISANSRGGWSSFWNSFALMFDTSALCKVMASISLRVDKAPQTEPFYVVLRSNTNYAYDAAYYYNTTAGAFYANTRDEDYNCQLDLYMEQWPAAEQERLQFIFAFVVPLLVLLLPLPFTMRRADLVQQYMMETDYAEWVWRPPYYLRNRLLEVLRACMQWVVGLRAAYEQRALLRQLRQYQQQEPHQQQQQHQQQQHQQQQVSRSGGQFIGEGGDKRNEESGDENGRAMPMPHFTSADAAPHDTSSRTAASPTSGAASADATMDRVGAENSDHAPTYASSGPMIAHDVTAARSGMDAVPTAAEARDNVEQSDGTLHDHLTPSANLASSSSNFGGSSTGSDCDELLDGRCRFDRQHSINCGAVSPPQKSCPPAALLYAEGTAAAAASSGCTTSTSTIAASASSALMMMMMMPDAQETGSPSASPPLHGTTCGNNTNNNAHESNTSSSSNRNANNRRSHRHCHHHHHHNRDGALRAVSVHVPFSVESPVVANARVDGDGNGRHASAHDLLFTTAEATGPAHLPAANASGEHKATLSREEKDQARCESSEPVTGTIVAGAPGTPQQGSSSNRPQAGAASAPPQIDAGGAARQTKNSNAGANNGDAEEEEEPFCRICREGSDVAPLITPCGCTGSVRFVHAACLDRWRLESAKRNLSNVNHCEICKMPFTVNIQRSTLIWESSQHILRGVCLFLTCLVVVVLTTTLTHGILGELSCLASYHEVAYSTMFRFEGLSLSLFVYGLAVLLVLFANLIVYSWFRSRPEVEEYVADMHVIPPFYTRRNMVLIVLVCLLLLAQVHAMGFLLKYFLYNTSNLVWSWEASPLVGGMLFALFMTCSITVCSWGRQMYMLHIVNRGSNNNDTGAQPAEDVVIEGADATAENNNADADAVRGQRNDGVNMNPQTAANPTGAPPPVPAGVVDPLAAGRFEIPTSTTLNYVVSPASMSGPPPAPRNTTPSQPGSASSRSQEVGPSVDPDVSYTRHFEVPPEQRVIRAFEYCPPTRKVPK